MTKERSKYIRKRKKRKYTQREGSKAPRTRGKKEQWT